MLSQSESEMERQSSTATLCRCVCPCSTLSGPPNQPVDVRDSKQTYSHHSEELKKKLRVIVDLFRLVGTKNSHGYQCVLHATKFFVILVDQQSTKAYLCFQSAN